MLCLGPSWLPAFWGSYAHLSTDWPQQKAGQSLHAARLPQIPFKLQAATAVAQQHENDQTGEEAFIKSRPQQAAGSLLTYP